MRTKFGVFENRVGVFQEDRENLLDLLTNISTLSAVCFVLNREPHLLDSIVNFQIKNFGDSIVDAILRAVSGNAVNQIPETRDMLEFIASVKPDILISNFGAIVDRLIFSEDDCLALVCGITSRHELIKIIGYLERMLEEVEKLPETALFKPDLRGLSNRSLSFYKVEKDRAASIDELVQAILDLKIFYASKGTHEGGIEYGAPLHVILGIAKLPYEARQRIALATYRDWREKTAKCIETTLAPNIHVINRIIEHEIGSHERRYFLKDEYMRDYLSLEKTLASMKEGRLSNLDDKANQEIGRLVTRLYQYVFDIATSPIAMIVKKIPVFIKKNIDERIEMNAAWLRSAGITIDQGIFDDQLDGLMTVGSFNKVLDYIFDNIKRHNFGIRPETESTSDEPKGSRIEIVANNIKTNNTKRLIEIIIRSNGPNKYNEIEHQGIATIKQICERFDAKYNINNNGPWVENSIKMTRWSHGR